MGGIEGGCRNSYLLRMWQEPSNGDLDWRISLVDVRTGEKNGFASLDDLLAYLAQSSIQKDKSPEEG